MSDAGYKRLSEKLKADFETLKAENERLKLELIEETDRHECRRSEVERLKEWGKTLTDGVKVLVRPLNAKIDKLTEQNRRLEEVSESLRTQVSIMKEALEFYSGTVEKQVEIWDKSLLIDRGDKAREALAKCKELEK